MDRLSLFGLAAVTAMLVFYALEHRSRWFILAFAALRAGIDLRFFAGSMPFGVIEIIWAAVAVHRWSRSRPANGFSA